MPVTRRQTQIKNDQQYRQGLYSELEPAINHGQNKHLGREWRVFNKQIKGPYNMFRIYFSPNRERILAKNSKFKVKFLCRGV